MIGFFRILTTAILLMLGFSLVPYHSFMNAAAEGGHGSYAFLSVEGLAPVSFFAILLAFRLWYFRTR